MSKVLSDQTAKTSSLVWMHDFTAITAWIMQFMRVLSAAFLLSLLCVFFCLFCLCVYFNVWFDLLGLWWFPGLQLLQSSGVWRGAAEVNVWTQKHLRALGRVSPEPHDGCWCFPTSHLTSLSAFIRFHALVSPLAVFHSLPLSFYTRLCHLKWIQCHGIRSLRKWEILQWQVAKIKYVFYFISSNKKFFFFFLWFKS